MFLILFWAGHFLILCVSHRQICFIISHKDWEENNYHLGIGTSRLGNPFWCRFVTDHCLFNRPITHTVYSPNSTCQMLNHTAFLLCLFQVLYTILSPHVNSYVFLILIASIFLLIIFYWFLFIFSFHFVLCLDPLSLLRICFSLLTNWRPGLSFQVVSWRDRNRKSSRYMMMWEEHLLAWCLCGRRCIDEGNICLTKYNKVFWSDASP